jgi:hypothetical protein
VSVSQFKIQCDFPECSRTLSHGAIRPPLSVTEFRSRVAILLGAHRWLTDAVGQDFCPFHSPHDDSERIYRHWRPNTPQLGGMGSPV